MEAVLTLDPQTWRRRIVLALVGGAHIFVMLSGRGPERNRLRAVLFQEPITYILAPRSPLQRPAIVRAAPTHALQSRLLQPSGATQAVQPAQQQASSPALPAIDPFAPPATQEDDLKQRALKSAAAIDKQMRKEAWNPHDKFVANDRTALASKIGSAYVGRDSGVTYEEVTLSDGRHMTKIHGPAGTYCAYMESNAMTGGRDPFRDGVKTKVGTCPM